MKHLTYSIGDTAKMTGASRKQIRHWEFKRYIPTADRVICGDRAYRRFTLKQVERIARIKELLDEGYSLAPAAERAKSTYLAKGKEFKTGGTIS